MTCLVLALIWLCGILPATALALRFSDRTDPAVRAEVIATGVFWPLTLAIVIGGGLLAGASLATGRLLRRLDRDPAGA